MASIRGLVVARGVWCQESMVTTTGRLTIATQRDCTTSRGGGGGCRGGWVGAHWLICRGVNSNLVVLYLKYLYTAVNIKSQCSFIIIFVKLCLSYVHTYTCT